MLIQSDSRSYNERGQGSGSPGEEGGTQWTKKWTRKWTRMLSFGKWTRMLSFGTVWKLHPGVWSSWLSWTLERYYEGWESGGKGAQKYGRRENVVREAEDSGPPVSLYPPPPFLGVTKKKLSSFYSQRITCIAQESEARNRNTSIRSQIILEFWNIWSLNLSFLRATDPNFLWSGSFGHP